MDNLLHRFHSVRIYEGVYENEHGERFMTVLADFKCSCGKEVIGYPENLGIPRLFEECERRRK